ncbi:GNAT family N-acetyltransferase [Quisquiliibacterium transsilvanicum]|uniref:GNAT superfamily N-acetyltransferase n=1 Tax=Quisquiliibacterium transsilvanicum TaxID=1549638 RepID=A0A7W8HJP7_9BURK|nr:GNAT family N-acetyltransferase [Quisquiliibacterium transsilvanicum]MBB5273309.1 GNAT superfamily N-acetyltransferase [Quisquiliibacterium transsilvanicum]
MKTFEIRAAQDGADYTAAAQLFREYAGTLGVDLGFQEFEAELRDLPGMYGPPQGLLVLAWPATPLDVARRDPLPAGGAAGAVGAGEAGRTAPVGCAAVRSLDGGDCEMKRLYVRDPARGSGLGRGLALAVIDAARVLGYRRMRLDTLGRMTAARALYASMGFVETPAYYDNPLPDVRYMALELGATSAGGARCSVC